MPMLRPAPGPGHSGRSRRAGREAWAIMPGFSRSLTSPSVTKTIGSIWATWCVADAGGQSIARRPRERGRSDGDPGWRLATLGFTGVLPGLCGDGGLGPGGDPAGGGRGGDPGHGAGRDPDAERREDRVGLLRDEVGAVRHQCARGRGAAPGGRDPPGPGERPGCGADRAGDPGPDGSGGRPGPAEGRRRPQARPALAGPGRDAEAHRGRRDARVPVRPGDGGRQGRLAGRDGPDQPDHLAAPRGGEGPLPPVRQPAQRGQLGRARCSASRARSSASR